MSNPSTAGHAAFTLWAQGQQIALSEGVSLERAQFPMLVPASPGGPVALVNVNPHDPTQLGLRNLTTSAWTATLPDGSSKEIGTDKSVRLSAGTVIQAGPLQWEIREQPAPAVAPNPSPQFGQGSALGHYAAVPPAGVGFLAASEPALPPQMGFLAASEPAPQAGFVQASMNAAPPMGFVQASPSSPIGFVQDNAPAMPGQTPRRPGGAARNIIATSSLSFSQLVPFAGERKVLMGKGFLIPGILTALFLALMFNFIGNFEKYNDLLAVYIGFGALFAVYRLCGKAKPWWILLASVIFTYAYMTWKVAAGDTVFDRLYDLFDHIGGPDDDTKPFPILLFHYSFAVGLREELTKAIPLFILIFVGSKVQSPLKEKIGVWEPLDGILLATASALGFTLAETLGQYVPNTIANVANHVGDIYAGQALGLELLIPRLIGTFTGHMAYSGYFGYFIGLSMTKPKHRWRILGIGLLTSIVLHGLWDSASTQMDNMKVEDKVSIAVTCILGVLSFAFLISAILKARQLSPDRVHNFATQIKGVS